MLQPYSFYPSERPVQQKQCPVCGLPMLLSRIEPSDDAHHDQRTFECSHCAYAEKVVVKFR